MSKIDIKALLFFLFIFVNKIGTLRALDEEKSERHCTIYVHRSLIRH